MHLADSTKNENFAINEISSSLKIMRSKCQTHHIKTVSIIIKTKKYNNLHQDQNAFQLRKL